MAFRTFGICPGRLVAFTLRAMENSRADRLGVVVSTACIAHCLLSPLIAAAAAATGFRFAGEDGVHRVFGVLIVMIGVVSFAPGYRRHRRSCVPAFAVVGTALVWSTAFVGEQLGPAGEPLLVIAGGLLLVRAHLWNRSFCTRCPTCAISADGLRAGVPGGHENLPGTPAD